MSASERTPTAFLSRRSLLRVGGIGPLALSLPELLAARNAAGQQRPARAESCLFVVQYGGCSHHDTFDMKPDAPQEIRGPFQPISTSVAGLQVCELLPRLARLAPKYAVVRSMTHLNAEHNGGTYVAMTGRSLPARDTPLFGSVVGRTRPPTRNVPAYVWIQDLDQDVDLRYLQGGFLGAQYAPLRAGIKEDNAASPSFRVRTFDPPENLGDARLGVRRKLLGCQARETRVPGGAAEGMQRLQEQAFDLITSGAARTAFEIQREPEGVRDEYGRHPLGQNLLLARRLIEAGVRMVCVNAWLGYPPGDQFIYTQGWDMHGTANQGSIFGTNQYGLRFALPRFDQSVAALLEDLDRRGLLETTLVVVVGEFGRTPKIVTNPFPGRDHWPNCYSALLAGGGIRGGLVYGASDSMGAYPAGSPVTPEDFGATLFHALGVRPETRLGLDGFTQPVSTGSPVLDLFA
jgi:hypothetical protein